MELLESEVGLSECILYLGGGCSVIASAGGAVHGPPVYRALAGTCWPAIHFTGAISETSNEIAPQFQSNVTINSICGINFACL